MGGVSRATVAEASAHTSLGLSVSPSTEKKGRRFLRRPREKPDAPQRFRR
jgi:hypothetical protein